MKRILSFFLALTLITSSIGGIVVYAEETDTTVETVEIATETEVANEETTEATTAPTEDIEETTEATTAPTEMSEETTETTTEPAETTESNPEETSETTSAAVDVTVTNINRTVENATASEGSLFVPEVNVTRNYSTGGATLSWEPIEGADAYIIYRDHYFTGSGQTIFTNIATVEETSYCVEVPVGETYNYKISAYSYRNPGAESDTQVVSVLGKCARPNVTVTVDESSGKPVLTWSAIEGATKYYIYRSVSGGEEKCIATTTSTSYAHAKATVGKTYTYRVKAVASVSGCASAYSKKVSCKVKCAQPQITATPSATKGRPTVKWDAVDGASKYYVYRTSPDGEEKCVANTTKTSYADTKATAGKTYTYRVKAVASKSGCASVHSEAVECKAKCARPVVTAYNNSSGKTVVKWEKITGASKYYIYRTGNDGKETKIGTTKKLYYADSSAVVAETYTYRVKAVAATEGYASSYSKSVTGVRQDIGHDWIPATCTEPDLCRDCGAICGAPLGHTTQKGKCNRCNKTIALSDQCALKVEELPKGVLYSYVIGDDMLQQSGTISVEAVDYSFKDYTDTTVRLSLTITCETGYKYKPNSPLRMIVKLKGCGRTYTEDVYVGGSSYTTTIETASFNYLEPGEYELSFERYIH